VWVSSAQLLIFIKEDSTLLRNAETFFSVLGIEPWTSHIQEHDTPLSYIPTKASCLAFPQQLMDLVKGKNVTSQWFVRTGSQYHCASGQSWLNRNLRTSA
jgi:hypothetical protein